MNAGDRGGARRRDLPGRRAHAVRRRLRESLRRGALRDGCRARRRPRPAGRRHHLRTRSSSRDEFALRRRGRPLRADDGAVWAAGDHGSVGAVDAAIRSSRFSPSSAQALAREYCTYGREAVAGLRTPRHVPRWRAVAPAVLVAASVAGLRARNRGVRFAVPALHAAACATAAWRLSEDPGVAPQRAFLALEISQWSFGIGAWSGVLGMLTAGSHADAADSRARQSRPA